MPDDISPSPKNSLERRIDTVTLLLSGLDTATLIEFSVEFYLDNSFVVLALRLVIYISFVVQRPASVNSNPQIAPVILSTILCFILHLFATAPQSVEGGSYGYNHGNIVIDLVGEPANSRWRLVFLDFLIAAIQLIMLALTWEKERLKGKNDITGVGDDTQQNLEAEEAGVRNSQDRIEHDLSAGENDGPMTDKFHTSEYIAVELDVVHCLKALWSRPPGSSSAPDDGGVIESLLARLAQRQ
jgi:hypothetical protein